eukprot:585880-Rhodomonas_salina.3
MLTRCERPQTAPSSARGCFDSMRPAVCCRGALIAVECKQPGAEIQHAARRRCCRLQPERSRSPYRPTHLLRDPRY